MPIKQTSANAVLVASGLNVTALQQLWLLDKGILERDEFGPGAIFTPVAVNVPNARFELLILDQRVQITFKQSFEAAHPFIERIIGGIVHNVSSTFTAAGFNFEILCEPAERNVPQLSRMLCLRDDNPLAAEFADDAARFGLTLYKPYGAAKLTIQIQPVTTVETGHEAMLCKFNVHRDLSAAGEIDQFIGTWPDALAFCNRLATQLDDSVQRLHVV